MDRKQNRRRAHGHRRQDGGRQARTEHTALIAALALVTGCAKISSTTHVSISRKPGAAPVEMGTAGHHVVEVEHALAWEQRLDEITLTLTAHRSCATRRFAPVVRTAHIDRKADGAYYWEWGLGLVLTGIGVVGMAAPQAISSTGLDENGNPKKDLSTGYRLGGILGGIGLVLVGAAIYDTVRAKDEYIYTEAYEPIPGEPVACADPEGPAAHTPVELVIGEHHARDRTDERGQVTFRLPAEPDLPEGERRLVLRGAVRLGPREALTFDYVAPYGLTAAAPHRGRKLPHDDTN